MNPLKNLLNWTCWMLVAPAFTFILSFVFNYSYGECVHSGAYVIFYVVYGVLVTFGYFASLEEDSKPMSFFK